MSGRFDRNERFFGREGQAKIASTRLAIVGAGGLGSIAVTEAAYLGFDKVAVIDGDVVTESSLNRMMGALPEDARAARHKVEVAERAFLGIRPEATMDAIPEWLDSAKATAAIHAADVILGCLDDDYARLVLTGLAAAAKVPLIDLATEIEDEGRIYGGRVVVAEAGRRCLSCLGLLDPEELALGGLTPDQRAARDRSYGLDPEQLGSEGASVVTINGVVASLGMTELMVMVTGLRPPRAVVTYYGHLGTIRARSEEPTQACFYCGRD